MLRTDILLSPFGADAAEMVDAAVAVEDAGLGGVWTLDHFSGSMLERPWSLEPFTVLGAIAGATRTVRLGPMVANMLNRHPVLLTSATATLQSMSRGRAVLGLGSGAAPGSLFAGEHEALGRDLGDLDRRRRQLVETIEVVRFVWAGGGDHRGEFFELNGLESVVGDEKLPPVIVGASSSGTVDLAVRHGDGVNVLVRPGWQDLVARAREMAGGRPFEISVYDLLDVDHPLGGEVDEMLALGVDCRVLAVRPPYPTELIGMLGERVREAEFDDL